MSTKHIITLSLVLVVLAGCNLMDRQTPPNIAETPPYLQPRSELAQSQLAEMRAFHEKESAKMSEDIRVARNREMERLEAAGKELEQERLWKEDYEKTQERRSKWTSWFKKTGKKTDAPMVSSRIGGVSEQVR